MQVLLKQNVDKLGQIGDIVTVKSGYARNYLLPRGIAMPVSEPNLHLVELEKQKHVEAIKRREEELGRLAEQLAASSVTIQARANEEGRLFGSVDAARIAEAFRDEGYPVEEDMVGVEEPFKEVGVYEAPIRLTPEREVTCKVWVVGE